MKISSAIAGGLAGTCTVALLHESLKKVTQASPRMELLDMEALSKILKSIKVKIPEYDQLLKWTLAGEIITHTLYYSVTGIGKKGIWLKGILLGVAAGITAVVLPNPLGLNGAPSNRSPQTEAMTIAMYLAGGLAASAVSKLVIDKGNP